MVQVISFSKMAWHLLNPAQCPSWGSSTAKTAQSKQIFVPPCRDHTSPAEPALPQPMRGDLSSWHRHRVQQLFSMVFLTPQDTDVILPTARVTAISHSDFHTPLWISALLYLADSSSSREFQASFQGQANVGMTTREKQEQDLISLNPSLTFFYFCSIRYHKKHLNSFPSSCLQKVSWMWLL